MVASFGKKLFFASSLIVSILTSGSAEEPFPGGWTTSSPREEMDRTMKRCLELWGDAPAELFGAAIGRPPALGADLATEKNAAGASLYADKKCGTVVPNRFAEGQRTDKKCGTVVPNRFAEGQRTKVNSSFSNG